MIKAIIFDLYNTLAYIDEKDYENAKKKMAYMAGTGSEQFVKNWKNLSTLSNKGILLTVEDRVKKILDNLNVKYDNDLIKKIAEVEKELQLEKVKLFPSTKIILEKLKEKNYKLGIISNCAWISSDVLQYLSIKNSFDAIIMSFQERTIKPNRKIYLLACKKLGVKPNECLFVGDGDDQELKGAKKVGMKTALINSSINNKILDDQTIYLDLIIDDLIQLLEINFISQAKEIK